jgi:carbamoyl-phosphate synthase / aspartate carbamoyltransferase
MANTNHESFSMALELQDGYVCHGQSFGAHKSIAGELVFQTGMVGYPESITDPSYRGQILVITFPLVGNYGVPSREERDKPLTDLPAYFEAEEIHIAGLVVASYSGEDYSHHLATSSLGKWLKEQGVPAITGVDTRALTKRIREEGSMLGRLLLRKSPATRLTNGEVDTKSLTNGTVAEEWRAEYEEIPWVDPNVKNLVAEGQFMLRDFSLTTYPNTSNSVNQSSQNILPRKVYGASASLRASCPSSLC